jgi:BMFP domain-containing protein YqiC
LSIDFNKYKLALFAKLPIYLDDIPFYSPTVKEIAEITEETYNNYLGISTLTKDRLVNDAQDFINLSDYDVFVCWLIGDESGKNIESFLKALKFWTKCNFTLVTQDNELYICLLNDEEKYVIENSINKSNYNHFINIIQFINCLKIEKPKKQITKSKNKALLEIEEKVRLAKQKINEKLNKNIDNKLDLFDLVSVLSANGNNISPLTIIDLNIFTFQDQFQRMQLVENYDIQIRSLLSAGAEIKNIEHYIKKL